MAMSLDKVQPIKPDLLETFKHKKRILILDL